MNKLLIGSALASIFLAPAFSEAQTVGGSTSLGISNVSANVALPFVSTTNKWAVVWPSSGASASNIFFSLGTSNTVAATTSSPPLLPGGECINIGPSTYLAGISSSGTATLQIKMMPQCPLGMGFAGNNISVSTSTLPTGAATSANQATGNGYLSIIATNSGAATPAGSNTIGAVTQASGPWTANITQLGGVAISTGAGATDSGTQRVVLATGGATQTTVAPGTAPSNANVIGGVYTATAPSPSDGQTMAVRLDAAGNLKIAATVGAPNWAGGTYSSIASNSVTTIAARATRHAITIFNSGTADLCQVATAGATSCTGAYSRIRPGFSKTLEYTGAVYLISSSGTGSAEFDETYF